MIEDMIAFDINNQQIEQKRDFNINNSEKRDDKKNPRYGVTASKKIGNAVERNKAKRRIRHAIKEVLPKYGKSGYDYVVIATIKTNKVSWNTVLNDLERAFKEIK